MSCSGSAFECFPRLPGHGWPTAQDLGGLVLWDYHVVLLEVLGDVNSSGSAGGEGGSAAASAPAPQHGQQHPTCLVWDLDTTLPFPCTLDTYCHQALLRPALLRAADELPPQAQHFLNSLLSQPLMQRCEHPQPHNLCHMPPACRPHCHCRCCRGDGRCWCCMTAPLLCPSRKRRPLAACRRRYRVVPAADYLEHFASDRSHMRRPDGSWSAPPPPEPCIVARDGCANRMQIYVDVSEAAATAGSSEQDHQTIGGEQASSGAAATAAAQTGSSGSSVAGSALRAPPTAVSGDVRFGRVLSEPQFLSRFGLETAGEC